ncbi:hypothetical protein EAL2_808p07550 (plasmid) [Peptoclostridium acidaminophilum DSM 3953]|uniref:Major facilitator superfamily (MFS) profile domain-containing protein n=1 Tax=Peptoclostridium acidaminophilum DSM 3953 TaxID=1286171 RepID=W8TKK0_PEPAC|nr:MFS transporter [Peptoclostridium acidaminophilum]AHM58258.1 hypothetical protein EAL2_808p07550 [Peptoclostridium acidaminophilum DSM 3953]
MDTTDYINWKSKTAIFLTSQTLSLFGSSIVGFAIIWHIALETSSGTVMTIAILCTFLPQIFISLFAGVWADRYSRKMLIMLSDSFIALSTLILAVMYAMGMKALWLIFLISIIRSIGSGVQTPAVGAILPQIVPSEKLMKVNGIHSTISSVMMLASPAVGGAILGLWGFSAALFFDVVTAAIAVGIMSLLSISAYQRSDAQEEASTMSDLKNGLIYSRNHDLVRNLLVFYSLFFFFVTPAAFLTPVLVTRSFGAEVWKLTANEMVWSAGSILGGLIITVWSGFKNKIHTMAISCLAFGITFVMLGLAADFIVYLIVMFVSGIFLPFFATAETVLIQENVAADMLGRVFSVIQIIVSVTMPLGMLVFGPMADLIKIQYLLIASGIVLAMLGLYIYTNKKITGLDNDPV